MAITDNSEAVNSEENKTGTNKPFVNQGNKGVATPFGFGNGSLVAGAMASIAGRDLSDWHESLKKHYAGKDQFNIKLIQLDNATSRLRYSVIVVCVSTKQDTNRVAYVPLIIASTGLTGTNLEDISISELMSGIANPNNRNGKNDTIQVPADSYDATFNSTVAEAVYAAYQQSGLKYVPVDGVVLFPGVQASDDEKTWSVAANAFNACLWELVTSDVDYMTMNISQEMKNSSNVDLCIEVQSDRNVLQNELQKPIRKSFVIEHVAKDGRRNLDSLNDQNVATVFNRTIGYVDIAPMVQQLGNGYNAPAQEAIRFRPHVILTNVSPMHYTPEYLLLGIANGMVLKTNDLWMHMIRPVDTDELHDPGALNYLANLENDPSGAGERLDLMSSGMTAFDVNSTLKRMFVNDIVMSIDIEIGGAQTWFTGVLAAAASNGKGSEGASKFIIQTLDEMTNGHFSNHFKPGDNIFSNVAKIPGGTWEDGQGVTRDLREIDLVAVCNSLGQEDVHLMQEFGAAEMTGSSNASAMVKRLEIMKMVVKSAVIDSRIMRLTFNPNFLLALEASLTASGFLASISSPTVVQGVSPLNSIGDYMQSAAMPQGESTFLNRQATVGGYGNYWSTPGLQRNF